MKEGIGILLLSLAAIWYLGKRTIDAVQINYRALQIIGIESGQVSFDLSFLIYNPLPASIKIDGIEGDIYMMGRKVAVVSQNVQQTVESRAYSELHIYFLVSAIDLGQALFDNIMTGTIESLTVGFDGIITINGIDVKLCKSYTFNELFSK